MAEDVEKPKAKRPKKEIINEVVEDNAIEPFIDSGTVKTGLGLFCLFTAILLFVAFFSYLFTWKEDQDKVLNFSWKKGLILILILHH